MGFPLAGEPQCALLTCHRNNYRALSKLTVMLGTDIQIPFDLEMEMDKEKGKSYTRLKEKVLLRPQDRYQHSIKASLEYVDAASAFKSPAR